MLNNFNCSDRAIQWMIDLGYLPEDKNLHQHHFQTKDAEYKELIKQSYTEGMKQIFNKLEQSEPTYPSMDCKEYVENEKKIVLQYMDYTKYQVNMLEYKMIELDSQRTSPHYDYFQQIYPETIQQLFYTHCFARKKREGKCFTTRQDLLKRILYIYTQQNYDQGCSYQSGMTYILAPLVYVIEKEADVYFCFSLLMHRIKEMYILKTKSDCINKMIATFDKSLEQKEPQIFHHLEKVDLNSTYYCVTWFLTCFSYQFDFEIVLLIWDKMLKYENIQEFQIQFILQVISQLREQILKVNNSSDGMQLMNGKNEQFKCKVLEVLKK